MKDFEILKFKKMEEALDFFQKQEENDIWKTVFTKELECLPLEKNELNFHIPDGFKQTIHNGTEVQFESISEEAIKSSMETTKMSIALPIEKLKMYPLRYTALGHIQERAGITGRTISCLKETGRAKELPPKIRAMVLNEGLRLYNDRTLCLIRDEKVTALLSGDEKDYQILPVTKLMDAVSREVGSTFQISFASGMVSHEIVSIDYQLEDDSLKKKIKDILDSNGYCIENVSTMLRLVTSDVGLCSAKLIPIIKADHIHVPMALPLSTTHKGENCMQCFERNCNLLFSYFRDNIANMERLMQIEIKNPGDKFKSLTEVLSLKGHTAALREASERLIQEHSFSCTAYDLYWYLAEALFLSHQTSKANGKEPSLFSHLKDMELISRVLQMKAADFAKL